MKISPVSLNLNIQRPLIEKQHNTQIENKPVSQPLKELSNVFYYPLSFTGKQPRTNSTSKPKLAEKSGDFVISRVATDIPCPACGKKMISKGKFQKIEAELNTIPPDQYLEFLGQYQCYMRPVEESVYKEIKAISDKDGEEKDIRTLLVRLRDAKLPILQDAQMYQLKKMKALAKTLPDDEQEILTKKIDGLEKIIKKNKNENNPFRRKIMLEGIKNIPIRNPHKYRKLQQIAKNFPVSSDMNSAWIVKYSGKNKQQEDWTSKEIALRMLSSSVANTDHILAYKIENNHDDISNYMSMHSACNQLKANKPFLEWLHEDKFNRTRYMQRYFDAVDGLIKSRRITKKKYKHYVALATETIFEVSKGQVKIEVKDSKESEQKKNKE